MKTIDLKIINDVDLLKLQKNFNSIVRYTFNRFQEGLKEKEVRYMTQTIFSNEKSWFLQCAVKDGQSIYNKFKNQKIIFGGKNNLFRYLKLPAP